MPSFNCPNCGEEFNSRKKREEHIQIQHSGETPEEEVPLGQRIREMFTFRKMAVIFGMLLMVGLPLGGTVFYSGTGGTNPGRSGESTAYTSNPPVGRGLRNVPEVDSSEIPQRNVLSEPLSKDMQVYLLLQGGKEKLGQGFRPSVLLQYSCRCPNTSRKLVSIAEKYPGWVYVAPYRDMNSTIAVSSFQRLKEMEEPDEIEIEEFICSSLRKKPLKCISGSLPDSNVSSSNATSSGQG
ncbi:MAG: hypothetical protein SVV03_03130 [Candidatus Nanohaloarchaea archaeon]|nr:hypothetical protein [Candidatus Nanohaloarchaea archaeon]